MFSWAVFGVWHSPSWKKMLKRFLKNNICMILTSLYLTCTADNLLSKLPWQVKPSISWFRRCWWHKSIKEIRWIFLSSQIYCHWLRSHSPSGLFNCHFMCCKIYLKKKNELMSLDSSGLWSNNSFQSVTRLFFIKKKCNPWSFPIDAERNVPSSSLDI